MLSTLREHIHGLTYLLMNPTQLKHIVIRETLYRQRYRNKDKWTEWQKYDTHTAAVQHSTAVAYARPLNKARIQIFSDMLTGIGSGLKVLDVGCGDGVISEPVARLGNTVTSMDLPTITKLAHKRHVSSVLAGDAEHLAFADGSFDVVLASEVVEHLWAPESFFSEAYRVLKPEGYLIVETPEGVEGLRYDAHKNYFTVEIIERMVGERFSVCRVERMEPKLGAPTSTIIVLLHKN